MKRSRAAARRAHRPRAFNPRPESELVLDQSRDESSRSIHPGSSGGRSPSCSNPLRSWREPQRPPPGPRPRVEGACARERSPPLFGTPVSRVRRLSLPWMNLLPVLEIEVAVPQRCGAFLKTSIGVGHIALHPRGASSLLTDRRGDLRRFSTAIPQAFHAVFPSEFPGYPLHFDNDPRRPRLLQSAPRWLKILHAGPWKLRSPLCEQHVTCPIAWRQSRRYWEQS